MNGVINSPSAKLFISDLGGVRKVRVDGLAYRFGQLDNCEEIFTPLTYDTIEYLIKIKGDWWLDEIERRQNYSYVGKRLITFLSRFREIKNSKILDIGSGCGSSAFILLDQGAKVVEGIEMIDSFVEFSNMRARNEGVSEKAKFFHVTDTRKLNYPSDSFDIITFNAVLEHVRPEIRKEVIGEAYRCLKRNGILVFTETPNRFFPYDGHTTRLPLLPWLPLFLSFHMAKNFSRHAEKGLNLEQYLDEGLIGGSYLQIKRAIPSARCLNLSGGDVDWMVSHYENTLFNFIKPILSVADYFFRLLHIPLSAFLPTLNLAFEKHSK